MSQEPGLSRWRQRAQRWLQRLGGALAERADETALPSPAVEPETDRPMAPPAAPPLDLAGLEKQVSKLGREQFKLNALLETSQQQVQAALQQLREQDERREKDKAELLARRAADLAEARLQVAQRLLPVLDGLDEALAAGERLLERAPSLIQIQAIRQTEPSRLPAWVKLAAGPLFLVGLLYPDLARTPKHEQQQAIARLAADMAAWQDSQIAWLRGLELVRERLLETLALEGVQPLQAAGRPFDPHQHVAVDTAPAGPETPPGTIVSELRRGYAAGPRVLRYAEVVVARAAEPSASHERPEPPVMQKVEEQNFHG